MKKLSIFLLGALAFAATSCEDGPSVTPVQTNPQGPVMEVDGVAAEQNPESAVINLKTLADAGQNIVAANFSVAYLPEGYNLKVKSYISKDENFSTSTEVPCTLTDNALTIAPNDFQDAYVKGISKSPAAKDVYIRFAAYAVNDNEELRLGGVDHYIGPFMMNVTPFPSDLVLEDNYYLLGTINGWSVADAIKFTHSDLSAYDDPVFTIVFDITAEQADAGWWWKIVPQSTKDAGDWVSAPYAEFGPADDGDDSMSGILMGSTLNEDGTLAKPGAGVIYEYGTFMLTIDMIEGTYSIQLAVPQLYVQGDAAGWNWDSPLVTTLTTTDYINYYGASKCAPGGYKFTSEKDWGATFNLGFGTESTPASGWTLAGTLENGGSNNIMPTETGLYWHHVNLPGLTFESMYISTLGVIGDCTPGGWDASTALTPSEDFLVWEGDIEFGATGSFKIRANNDWVFSLGGDINNLDWNNAPNIDTPGAGTKHVVLDLSKQPFTLTIQ